MATKKYVSFDKLSLYDEKIKKVISDADAAALKSAKDYADSLAGNYEAAGAVNTAKTELQGKIDTVQTNVDTVSAANVATQGEVDALETYVGTFTHDTAKSVVEYINAKTDGIATSGNLEALGTRVSTVEGKVATIEGDYLKTADKTELSDAIAAEKERAEGIEGGLETRLKAVEDDYLKGADKTELQGNIDVEKGRIDGIVADYLKAADKTELEGKINAKADQTALDAEVQARGEAITGLQTQINTIMNNPDADKAINSINEFTAWVSEHGTVADGMRTDINKNKDDIAAEVKRAGEAEAALAERIDDLEAIDHEAYVTADTALEGRVDGKLALKADASALTSAVEALEGVDAELSGKITALENKFGTGEGSVSDMISDAMDAEVARVDGELAKKVDKVEGKGLSTNDLTNELKANYDAAYEHSQAAHAPANAQANVIESVKVNGAALTITDKAVDISVPTDNAQLTNGAGYLVAGDIANKADKATTLAGYGIADAYTSAQTDAAIATAMEQFKECSQEDIESLFNA